MGENRNPWYGERNKGKPLDKVRGHSETPLLGLPDVIKPFYLYVRERKGIAVRVLTKLLGSWHRPVAYLSK
jgi:hypothetical protein